MKPIRVLVVDDERPARDRVRRLLARDARVTLVGAAAGGADAVAMITDAASKGVPVQVLCLDVQMPELDGFGVIARLITEISPADLPAVVFVTAHDEFAVRAFESRAVDYLLKPFGDERFQAALDHAIRQVRSRHSETLLAEMQALLGRSGERATWDTSVAASQRPPMDKIVLRGGGRIRLLPVDQIAWIEAEGMYVNIHTREGHRAPAPRPHRLPRAVARFATLPAHPPLGHHQHRSGGRAAAGRTRRLRRRAAGWHGGARGPPISHAPAGTAGSGVVVRPGNPLLLVPAEFLWQGGPNSNQGSLKGRNP